MSNVPKNFKFYHKFLLIWKLRSVGCGGTLVYFRIMKNYERPLHFIFQDRVSV